MIHTPLPLHRRLCLAALLGAALVAAAPAQAGRVRNSHANAEGGTTRSVVAARGGEAASAVRGHRLVTDGQGNARRRSAAAGETAGGGRWQRAGETTRQADGSAAHRSAFSASGPRGTVQSSGSATRSADGHVEQSRSTTATSATTGNSRTSTTRYDSDSGLSRSATCFDASGASIPCKR